MAILELSILELFFLKLLLLIVILIISSSIFFSTALKKRNFLILWTFIMTMIIYFYLSQDIYHYIKGDVAELESELTGDEPTQVEVKFEKTFPTGTIFRDRLKDGSLGPKMVWIATDTFKMGDIPGDGNDDEQPVHYVSISQFAIGLYEVTVDEFRRFVEATGYQTEAEKKGECLTWLGDNSGKNWRDPGFTQTDNHPVVCVNWHDAYAYAHWLTEQTEQKYRLPSEAEWEYAARTCSTTKYWWGHEIGSNRANCYENDCGDNFEYTAPVGSFVANSFGLYDTAGNVWEWTCSEYENRYQGQERRCVNNNGYFVLRGGSWHSYAWGVRSTFRNRLKPVSCNNDVGIRLAR